MTHPAPKLHNLQECIVIGLKGFCMGAADVIPGISGGTIAFLLGIYEDLIEAIRTLNIKFLKNLFQFKIKEAFAGVSWRFLISVHAGILCAIFSLSKVITWLLTYYPVLLHAFFFGLILATIPIIGRNIRDHSVFTTSVGILAAILTFYLVGLVPIHTPETNLFLFFCGVIAICAMILPGISGAFILILLGKYQYIISAVNDRDLIPLFCVGLGCVVGILTFVRVLHWLLDKNHDLTVTVLTGLVLGSLRKVWPWKETLQSLQTNKGKIIPIEQINIWPPEWNLQILTALALMFIGFGLAWALSMTTPPKQFIKNQIADKQIVS